MRILIIALVALLALSACDTSETTPEQTPDTPDEPAETPPTPPTFCGDGAVQDPNDNGVSEACDDGRDNGEPCTAPYGGSCTYCTDACDEATVEGGFCGDDVCQDAESADACPADCEREFEQPEDESLLYYLPRVELNGTGEIRDEDVDLSDTFTIAAWVYRNEQAPGYIVSRTEDGVDTRGGYSLSVQQGGYLEYETHKLSTAQSQLRDVPIEEWVHVAVTYDVSDITQIRFYANGEQVGIANGVNRPRDLSTPLLIGRRGPPPEFGFNGSIADLRIYDRTLSAEEIGELSDQQP